jgi:type IV pilus assembly protein PilE
MKSDIRGSISSKISSNISRDTCYRYRSRRETGFTLMDLMMAVAIVGILSMLAVSAYSNVRLKITRAEGRAALMQLMHQQERYYTLQHRYLPFASADATAPMRRFSGSNASTSAYRMEAIPCPAQTGSSAESRHAADNTDAQNCIQVRAIAVTGNADPLCQVLTLDSDGDTGAGLSGSTGIPAGCR